MASPAGQAARARAMRLLSAAGGDETSLYFDELRRVLDELYDAGDVNELSSWLAMLIDALVLVAGGAISMTLEGLHGSGAEIDREGLLLAIDRTIEKLVVAGSAPGS